MNSELIKHDGGGGAVGEALSPKQLLEQVGLIQEIMRSVMKKDEHYGCIPGCGSKPALLKSGAEKLAFTFRLRPEFEDTVIPCGADHREYKVKCTVFSLVTGRPVAQALGSCSTMEAKYRYRTEYKGAVPQEYWENKDPMVLGGFDFFVKKKDDKWVVYKRIEHDNPADHYNTVLKMAQKRAYVSAILNATAASDIFTTDIEEVRENMTRYGGDEEEAEEKPVEREPQSSHPGPSVSESVISHWRDVKIHFGKNKGKRLGDLDGGQLHWYKEKWQPKEYPEGSGKFSKADIGLRAALDAAMAEKRERSGEVDVVDDDLPYENAAPVTS